VTTVAALRYEYATALEAYLAEPSEGALRVAYELGRDAVARELSVLDLAAVHHDALRVALGAADSAQVADAAAQFFLESLSAFEMLQRGFRETQDAARAEQRQAAMLRQLSSFLGDASLAFEEAGSIDEMLQLVAEQARELLEAECCVAYATVDDDVRVEAVSGRWADVGSRATLFKLAALVHGSRLAPADLAEDPAAVALGGLLGRPLRGLLAAPLTALDGRELGSIQVFDPQAGGFTDVHEAQLLHLTQVASAALERVALYARGRRIADALRHARNAGGSSREVVVRHRNGDAGGAVWFETARLEDGRIALVAGEVRGPAPAVAATQARAAACALIEAGASPRDLVGRLADILGHLAPDNPARAAAALVDADRALTFVDGAGEAAIELGAGAALVVHVGGGPPAVAVEAAGAEAAAARVFAALGERGDSEVAVLAVGRPA
jgi:hypothetical protein